MVTMSNRIKKRKFQKNVSEVSKLQKCLKWLKDGNPYMTFLIGMQFYFIVVLIVFGCVQNEDQFYSPNGERYEFVQQMRTMLTFHDTVQFNNLPYEEKYEPPADYILAKKSKLKIRKFPVKLTYENGDTQDCILFDSKVQTYEFGIKCDQKIFDLKDWGKYNMVFGDKEKCFQATLYNNKDKKMNLETATHCGNVHQIFERHTFSAHVTIDIETLTKQGYVLQSELATSIVLRYQTDNPARWLLQEKYERPGGASKPVVLYETSVVDLQIHTGDLKKNPDSCLAIEFRTTKNITWEKLHVEITEQCTAIERLYEQTTKDISRTYKFYEKMAVEDGVKKRYMYDVPAMFRRASFVFNFDEEQGTPNIYHDNDSDKFTKVDLKYISFEDLRTNKFQDKYCYKMVLNHKDIQIISLYADQFCEQMFIDTTYFRKLKSKNNATSKRE